MLATAQILAIQWIARVRTGRLFVLPFISLPTPMPPFARLH
jgi:hypothetical protein